MSTKRVQAYAEQISQGRDAAPLWVLVVPECVCGRPHTYPAGSVKLNPEKPANHFYGERTAYCGNVVVLMDGEVLA